MTEILSLVISLFAIIGSFLTTFFNIRWNIKSHIKETVFAHQNDVYIRFLHFLISIQRNPYSQFNEKNLSVLEKMQAEFFIYADEDCREDFSKIYEALQSIQTEYKTNRKNETATNDDNIRIESDPTAVFDIQAEDEHYKDTHKITDEKLKAIIDDAINHIKASLGVKEK